ncbi:hypothetical protein L596_005988 [Steinernema carpocapsae]|uniref:Tyrosine--tRNA ligase n=1 Tax=Steinernema carpocapsae TaxID=34508 RepID=A0A4V6YSZ5_STECR|nr:hypothetical protein L596_005988 [Steinernema carpocapsae]
MNSGLQRRRRGCFRSLHRLLFGCRRNGTRRMLHARSLTLHHIVAPHRYPSSSTRALNSGGLLDLCADLKQRNLISDSHPPNIPDKQRELIAGLPNVLYAGFDPTAEGLHVGNLLVLTALCRATLFNCRSIALVGSATALIGDPSGRSTERHELHKTAVLSNTSRITEQIGRILGNAKKINAAAETNVVNNMDWWGEKNALDFKDISENFRVGNMLRMGAIKTRLEEVAGINYAEFCYQIFQSYDWHFLAEKYGCYFQVGGSDQLGHLDSGYDYIRRMNGKLSAGVCLPLVTDEQGRKLGKSVSSGNSAIWLDGQRTSRKVFYEFFVKQSDEMAARLLMFYSLRPINELLDTIFRAQRESGLIQRELADEITELVHGSEDAEDVCPVHQVKVPALWKEHVLLENEKLVKDGGLLKFCDDLVARGTLQQSYQGEELKNLSNALYFPVGDFGNELSVKDLLSLTTLLRSVRFGCKPVVFVTNDRQKELVEKVMKNAAQEQDVEVLSRSSLWEQKSCIDLVRQTRNIRVEEMLRLNSFESRVNEGFSNADLMHLVMSTFEWQKLSEERDCHFQIRSDDQSDYINYARKYVPCAEGVCISAEQETDYAAGQAPVLLDASISLDGIITSPYAFYQFFRNQHDTQAEKLTLALSLKPVDEIKKMFVDHRANLGKWIAQTALAEEMTLLVHGEAGLDVARRCSKAMFGGSVEDWETLDAVTLVTLFGESSTASLSKTNIRTMGQLADGARLDSHRGSALMKSGAFRVNGVKYVDSKAVVNFDDVCLKNSGLTIVKWGRRNFSLVKWVD